MQSDSAVAPGVGRYVPASHSSTVLAPSSQKCPAVQSSHAVWPALAWNLPAVQSVHVAWPVVAVIVPGAHCVCAVEPVEQADPAGHVVHSEAAARPALLENDPAAHGSAAAAPVPQ